jgi:AcrR family transcriptional regulator
MAKDTDRRTGLLKRAAHVFLEHGYEATSMNLIAERAGISKPGLYYHFKSKQELLFSIMAHAMDHLERSSREATLSSSDNEERLKKLIGNHARMITQEEEGAFTLLVIDLVHVLPPEDRRLIDQRKRAYFELVRATLEQLRKEGKLRSDLDETVAAFSLLGMVMWISKWFRADGALGNDEVAAQVTELALTAVLRDDRRG